MNFGGWVPLGEAPAAAPDLAGVLQARADALLPYPKGKSAMVLYARCASEDTLRRYVGDQAASGLTRAAALGARWIRFGAARDPEVEYSRAMRRFEDRFGAPPAANAANRPEGDGGGEGDGDGVGSVENEEARSGDG